MKEILTREGSLFAESIKNHQRLVNILIEAKNEAGISQLSQPDMAKLMMRSQTWVGQAIKRLNTQDICVEMIGPENYILHYTDILAHGVFSEIMKLIIDCYESPELFLEKDSEIAAARGINVKTVQMFKAYLRTGWKKELRVFTEG